MGRLSLSLGVRYDRNDGHVPASTRVAGTFSEAATFPKVQFAIWNSFAPRVHFAYDLTGSGKTALKGGWGRFNKMRFTGEIRNGNGNDRIESTYTWRDLNGDRFWNPSQVGEVNLDPSGPDFVSNVTSVGTPREPNPDERQPTVDEFSLNLEHEVVQTAGRRARKEDKNKSKNDLTTVVQIYAISGERRQRADQILRYTVGVRLTPANGAVKTLASRRKQV